MDYRAAFQISATGMNMERLRLDVTALNVANTHSSASKPSDLYQPLRVIVNARNASFTQTLREQGGVWRADPDSVATEVVQVHVTPRLVHDPGHPHADVRGMVAYPGIDHTSEMLNLMTALRAYEANVAAASASRSMAARALEIGGQS